MKSTIPKKYALLNLSVRFYSFLFIILSACNNSETSKKEIIDSSKSYRTDSFYFDSSSSASEILLPDNENESTVSFPWGSEMYSREFLNGLRKFEAHKVYVLQDSFIVLDNRDTSYFPTHPEIGKKFTLIAHKDDLVIALDLRRINYTTIEYNLEMMEFGKTKHNENGMAHISPGFFLGSEVDESDISGTAYLATEFINAGKNECFTNIRLGYEITTGNSLLGKLIKNCNGKIRGITLDNFPTLKEK